MKSSIVALISVITLCSLNCLAIADDVYWDIEATPDSKITEKDFDVRVHGAETQDKLTNRGVYDDGRAPDFYEDRKPAVIPGTRNVDGSSTQRDSLSDNREPSSLRLRGLPERNRRIERPVSVNRKPGRPYQDVQSTQRGSSKSTTDSGKGLIEATKAKPKQLTTPPGPRKELKENTSLSKPSQDDGPGQNKLKWGKVELESKDDKNKLQWKK